MNKKIFTLAIILISVVSLWAQSPEKMSYQAVVRNSSNALVTSATVGMKISILEGNANGNSIYVETQTPGTNSNGLISLEIGTGTVVSGAFSTIDWADGPYFIKTEIDPIGGTTYTITGTSQLMSVPYALYAKTAETAETALMANTATTATTALTANTATHAETATSAVTAENVTNDMVNDADADPANEIQTLTVSQTGDTLTISGGNSVLVPGISALNYPIEIGSYAHGGVVFWLDGNGGGLVCAIEDQNSASVTTWHNGTNTNTTAVGTAIGTGQANTTIIINSQGSGTYAAKLCADLTLNGYSDWFLPSKDELNEMFINRTLINATSVANGGAAFTLHYWSSSQQDGNSNNAWIQFLNSGGSQQLN